MHWIRERGTPRAAILVVAAAAVAVVLLLVLLPVGAQAVSYNAEEIAFVQLINQYRVDNGLEPLLVSDLLLDSSTKHNFDMGKYGFFGHNTVRSDYFPIGAGPGDRMVLCGYPQFVSWGENIAAGYPSAAAVFTAWRYSDSHNLNMLGSKWKVVGVSMETIPGSEYGTYWTTDFGSYVDGTAHEAGSPTPADVTSPMVTIGSPVEGADLSGVVSVTVTASDNLAVTRVELYVAGRLVGSDTTSPYVIAWDTSGLDTGAYGLEARAYDAAGNVGVFTRTVHVSSTPGAATTTTTSPSTTTTTTTPSTTTTSGTTPTTTTTTTSTTLAGTVFPDVSPSNRFYKAISSLAAAGVVTGYDDGLFHPNDSVTRAQFAKIIVLALDEHTAAIDNVSTPTFSDVSYTGSDYPYDFVEEAAGLGIVEGFENGTFGPRAKVTRAQLAIMLVRAGGMGLATPPAGYVCPFTDVPAYAREAVRVARFNNLVSGNTATTFDPYSPATRGQVAKMVHGLTQALAP
jgi:hypothetical protein